MINMCSSSHNAETQAPSFNQNLNQQCISLKAFKFMNEFNIWWVLLYTHECTPMDTGFNAHSNGSLNPKDIMYFLRKTAGNNYNKNAYLDLF